MVYTKYSYNAVNSTLNARRDQVVPKQFWVCLIPHSLNEAPCSTSSRRHGCEFEKAVVYDTTHVAYDIDRRTNGLSVCPPPTMVVIRAPWGPDKTGPRRSEKKGTIDHEESKGEETRKIENKRDKREWYCGQWVRRRWKMSGNRLETEKLLGDAPTKVLP